MQLTTDGHRAYLQAIEDAFGKDIDYSQLVKLYGFRKERSIIVLLNAMELKREGLKAILILKIFLQVMLKDRILP